MHVYFKARRTEHANLHCSGVAPIEKATFEYFTDGPTEYAILHCSGVGPIELEMYEYW